jgi:mRNA interferase MazF
MKKDFRAWHTRKEKLEENVSRPFFHEGEIWWSSVGVNVGFEQDGGGTDYLRPVLVYRKFNKEIFWGIPLTHADKNGRFYFKLSNKNSGSTAILSQIRLMDAKRLSHKMGGISKEDFITLNKKFKELLP